MVLTKMAFELLFLYVRRDVGQKKKLGDKKKIMM